MGLDMTYQAIPDNCALLERSLKDTEFGELLQFLPGIYKHGAAAWQDGKHGEFRQQALELAKRHSGLETRNCHIGRYWDCLHYLLSGNRRGEGATDRDAALDKAVRGSDFGAICLGQGVPLGYVSAIDASKIDSLLHAIDPQKLKLYYVPEKMEHKAVYKFDVSNAGKYMECALEAFMALRALYQKAAAHKEGVLVILD